jgi:hypothetical protein
MLRRGCGGGDAVSNDGGGDGGALARGDTLTGGNNSFDGLSLMVSLDVIIRWCYLVHFFWAHLVARCSIELFFWI